MKYITIKKRFIFYILIVVLFFLKSIVYLSVIPPLEGWDEYQHIAYISYIEKYGKRPIFNKSFVPRDLMRQIVQFPAPKSMLDQTGVAGSVSYKIFYENKNTEKYNEHYKDIGLYQSQHGDLYYMLMVPFSKLFQGKDQLLNKIYILRLINILFVATSLLTIIFVLDQIIDDDKHVAAISFLILSHPVLLINSCRVSNDSLSIMIGTFVILIAIIPYFRTKIITSALSGVLIGASCWAKSTSLILFPFWSFCLFFAWHRKELTLKKFIINLLVSYTFASILLMKNILFNIDNYGMLFVMQESIINKENNKSLFFILKKAFEFNIIKDILLMWTTTSWIGGWSFLRVRNINNIINIVVVTGFLARIYGYFFSINRKKIIHLEISLYCLVICIFTSFALSWHYIQSVSAWGQPTTCPWYLSISLPFFLLFIYDSYLYLSEKIGFIIGLLLISVYMYADIRGIITMISFYSGEAAGIKEKFLRISSIHPDWLGAPVLISSFLLFISLYLYLYAQLLKFEK